MKMNGNGLAENGYTYNDLKTIRDKFKELGARTKIYNLHKGTDFPKAYVLHVKNAIKALKVKKSLFNDLTNLDWDTQYFDVRRQKVLNKHARYNLCFGEENIDADYENKIGTVISYNDIPQLKKLRDKLMELTDFDETSFQVEGNYYYDINKTGIGFHGDGERKRVIGVNLSDDDVTRIIRWKWFQHSQAISEPIDIELKTGDLYIMSEYATGYNWKSRNIPTLRHSAGVEGSKYIS
jgi:hypothetical protein